MCTFNLDSCEFATVEHIDQILFQLEELKYELLNEAEEDEEERYGDESIPDGRAFL